jgi:hypothetical protein
VVSAVPAAVMATVVPAVVPAVPAAVVPAVMATVVPTVVPAVVPAAVPVPVAGRQLRGGRGLGEAGVVSRARGGSAQPDPEEHCGGKDEEPQFCPVH